MKYNAKIIRNHSEIGVVSANSVWYLKKKAKIEAVKALKTSKGRIRLVDGSMMIDCILNIGSKKIRRLTQLKK